MLVIECPFCGPRNSSEFTYSGMIKPRPAAEPEPAEWRRYLYEQDNIAGWSVERWFHVSGCRRYLDVRRHSVTNEIAAVTEAGGGQ